MNEQPQPVVEELHGGDGGVYGGAGRGAAAVRRSYRRSQSLDPATCWSSQRRIDTTDVNPNDMDNNKNATTNVSLDSRSHGGSSRSSHNSTSNNMAAAVMVSPLPPAPPFLQQARRGMRRNSNPEDIKNHGYEQQQQQGQQGLPPSQRGVGVRMHPPPLRTMSTDSHVSSGCCSTTSFGVYDSSDDDDAARAIASFTARQHSLQQQQQSPNQQFPNPRPYQYSPPRRWLQASHSSNSNSTTNTISLMSVGDDADNDHEYLNEEDEKQQKQTTTSQQQNGDENESDIAKDLKGYHGRAVAYARELIRRSNSTDSANLFGFLYRAGTGMTPTTSPTQPSRRSMIPIEVTTTTTATASTTTSSPRAAPLSRGLIWSWSNQNDDNNNKDRVSPLARHRSCFEMTTTTATQRQAEVDAMMSSPNHVRDHPWQSQQSQSQQSSRRRQRSKRFVRKTTSSQSFSSDSDEFVLHPDPTATSPTAPAPMSLLERRAVRLQRQQERRQRRMLEELAGGGGDDDNHNHQEEEEQSQESEGRVQGPRRVLSRTSGGVLIEAASELSSRNLDIEWGTSATTTTREQDNAKVSRSNSNSSSSDGSIPRLPPQRYYSGSVSASSGTSRSSDTFADSNYYRHNGNSNNSHSSKNNSDYDDDDTEDQDDASHDLLLQHHNDDDDDDVEEQQQGRFTFITRGCSPPLQLQRERMQLSPTQSTGTAQEKQGMWNNNTVTEYFQDEPSRLTGLLLRTWNPMDWKHNKDDDDDDEEQERMLSKPTARMTMTPRDLWHWATDDDDDDELTIEKKRRNKWCWRLWVLVTGLLLLLTLLFRTKSTWFQGVLDHPSDSTNNKAPTPLSPASQPLPPPTTTTTEGSVEASSSSSDALAALLEQLVAWNYATSEQVSNSSSPQHLAAAWLLDMDQPPQQQERGLAASQVFYNSRMLQERYALATLFYATAGQMWLYPMKWLSAGVSVCDWNAAFVSNTTTNSSELWGVDCACPVPGGSETSRLWQRKSACDSNTVKRLVLPHVGLTGSLPSQLGLLRDLQEVRLPHNHLTGSIPVELFHLSSLTLLDLHRNNLTGPLPESVTPSPSLSYLNLAENQLTGHFPDNLFHSLSHLRVLNLNQNQFVNGSLLSLTSLSQVEALFLQGNAMPGELTDSLLHSWPSLRVLDLSNNRLQGTLPSSLFSVASKKESSKLVVVDLHANGFHGTLPNMPVNTKSSMPLRHLRLSSNIDLTGTIPHSLFANLKQLEHLDLSNCHWTGILPTSLGALSNLQHLSLSDNTFLTSAPIPSWIPDLTQLQTLSLASTMRSGGLLPQLGQLEHLETLDLSHNLLNGPLPHDLTDSTHALRTLLLNDNDLTGAIPFTFVELDLVTLLLQETQVSGNANHICSPKLPRLDTFLADCKRGSDNAMPELDCACCTMCCDDSDPNNPCDDIHDKDFYEPATTVSAWDIDHVREHFHNQNEEWDCYSPVDAAAATQAGNYAPDYGEQ